MLARRPFMAPWKVLRDCRAERLVIPTRLVGKSNRRGDHRLEPRPGDPPAQRTGPVIPLQPATADLGPSRELAGDRDGAPEPPRPPAKLLQPGAVLFGNEFP